MPYSHRAVKTDQGLKIIKSNTEKNAPWRETGMQTNTLLKINARRKEGKERSRKRKREGGKKRNLFQLGKNRRSYIYLDMK